MQQKEAASSSSSSKPGGDAGLEFVLIEQPTKRASGDVRRKVRSHVTKLQHQKSREREIQSHATSDRPFIQFTSQDVKQKPPPKKAGKVTKAAKPKKIIREDAAGKDQVAKRRHTQVLQIRSPKKEPLDDDDDAVIKGAEPYWSGIDLSGLNTAFSRGVFSFRTFALDDSTNTVGSSLEALGLDVSSVMACYKLIVQIQARDFEKDYIDRPVGYPVWERFFCFVFEDPCLLTVTLLITIRYRLENMGYRNRSRDFMEVLRLEEFLIKRVNAALCDPDRAISSPMLVAVALCSAYEVKNANPAAYHVHMQGLLRMINLRGGLLKIAKEDWLLERMLIWHDVNTAAVIGNSGYLVHLPNSLSQGRPSSNLPTFKRPIENNEVWLSKFEVEEWE